MGTAAHAMPIFFVHFKLNGLNGMSLGTENQLGFRIELLWRDWLARPALELKTVLFRVGKIEFTVAAFVF